MKNQILFVVALLASSSAALSATSVCDTDCEKSFKYCASAGKSTQKACLAEREKCRKSCIKKEKALPLPGGG